MSEEKKSGFISLIGRPNVGKSTLMNHLVGKKIAITSRKPQTTRNQIRAVLTRDEGQIVFVDTPGVQKARNKLGEYMERATALGMRDVDVILWLVEASPYIGEADRAIAGRLQQTKIPVVLVINKADLVSRDVIAAVIESFRHLMDFAEIVPVSALKGTNLDELERVLFSLLHAGPQYFDADTLTDQPERQIVSELIREKALRCLNEEVPYGIAVTVETMRERERKEGPIMDIEAEIICEKSSHKGIIIGKNGAMLKKIGSAARYEIERLLGIRVNLKLWVRVKKDWRDSDYLVRNFGYDRRDL